MKWATTKQACRDELEVYFICTALMRPGRPKQYSLQLDIALGVKTKLSTLSGMGPCHFAIAHAH